MLGSKFDGEVVNAARMAERLRHQDGLSWGDLVDVPQLAPAADDDDDNVLHACRGRLNLLTPWERNFISSVSRQRYPLTVKQRRVLRRLIDKVRPWRW